MKKLLSNTKLVFAPWVKPVRNATIDTLPFLKFKKYRCQFLRDYDNPDKPGELKSVVIYKNLIVHVSTEPGDFCAFTKFVDVIEKDFKCKSYFWLDCVLREVKENEKKA